MNIETNKTIITDSECLKDIKSINRSLDKIIDNLDTFDSRVSLLENYNNRPILNGNDYDNNKNISFLLNDFVRNSNNYGKFCNTEKFVESNFNFADYMFDFYYNNSVLRSLCSVDKVSSSSVTYVQYGDIDSTVKWGDSDATDGGVLVEERIDLHSVHAQAVLNSSLISDVSFNIEEWLNQNIFNALLRAQDKAFIDGSGTNQPQGMLKSSVSDNTTTITLTTTDDPINVDELIGFFATLPTEYSNNSSLIMHRSVLHKLRTLKQDSAGNYLWSPTGYQGKVETFFGIPVFETYGMPEWGTADKPLIVIADFKQAYKIVDLLECDMLKDQFSKKPNTTFYATSRVGGTVLNCDALRFCVFDITG